MSDRKLDAIKRVPLFAQCTRKELEFVGAQMDEIHVPQGTELIKEGERGHSFYILLEGSADVVIGTRTVASLKPGDFFGEISMIDMGPATATVTATSAARMLVMSHRQFRDAITSNDKVAIQVVQAMAERLRENELR